MAEETFVDKVDLDDAKALATVESAFGANDELDIEIENDGNTVDPEIEIEDDTPEGDRGKWVAKVGEAEGEELDAELVKGKDGGRFQKRISEFKAQVESERRAKEKLFREHQEAVAFAKQLHARQEELEARARKAEELNLHGEGVVIERSKRAIELETLQAQAEYEAALNTGDPKTISAANAKVAKAIQDASQIAGWENQYKLRLQQAQEAAKNPPPQVRQPQQVQRPQVSQDPGDVSRRTNWQTKNTWFGKDQEMTAAAQAIHVELVQSGVDAVNTPDLYWSSLDARVKAKFPTKFAAPSAQTQTPGTVVPGVTRQGTGKATRKVVLKASEVELAKSLGLTPAQYAAAKG